MSGDADRHVSPYTMREKMARVLWATTQATLFRLSFPNFRSPPFEALSFLSILSRL